MTGADAERDDRDRGEREAGRLQRAAATPYERSRPNCRTSAPARASRECFADGFGVADGERGRAPRLLGRHAGVEVGLHLPIEMKLQLFVQLAIERRRTETTRATRRRDDGASACIRPFVNTRPMPLDSRSHAASSCASRFCPALVSR